MSKKTNQNPATEAPARKKRGAILVHEQLREDIQWMRIAPGSALDEVALASDYGVSRTPIREALLLLATEGFVHFLQNRTTIVAPVSLHNQAAFLDTFILLSRGLVRAAAPRGAAHKAALLAQVSQYAERLREGDVEGAFRAQLALFRQVAGLTENRFLSKYFLEAQDASVRVKLLYYFPHLHQADIADTITRLEAVVRAITDNDADAADAAVTTLLLSENAIIQRGLGPRFGHSVAMTHSQTHRQEPQ